MRRFISFVCFLAGLMVAVVGAEALFRVIPTADSPGRDPNSRASLFPTWVPNRSSMGSLGWNMQAAMRQRTNAQGFMNAFDYQPGGAEVAVIGDSYIEARMIPSDEKVQGQLEKELGLRGKVYALAGSGWSLADYLVALREAGQRYGARTVVMLVHENDVQEAREGGNGLWQLNLRAGPPALRQTKWDESALKDLFARSALVRYVFLNLREEPASIRDKIKAEVGLDRLKRAKPPKPKDDGPDLRAAMWLAEETERLSRALGVRVVIMADTDRGAIYRGEKPKRSAPFQAYLDDVRRRGVEVVDLEPAFTREWTERGRRLDFLPLDRHWNGLAHAVAAREVVARLKAGQ